VLIPVGLVGAATVALLAVVSMPLLLPGACILLANEEFRGAAKSFGQHAIRHACGLVEMAVPAAVAATGPAVTAEAPAAARSLDTLEASPAALPPMELAAPANPIASPEACAPGAAPFPAISEDRAPKPEEQEEPEPEQHKQGQDRTLGATLTPPDLPTRTAPRHAPASHDSTAPPAAPSAVRLGSLLPQPAADNQLHAQSLPATPVRSSSACRETASSSSSSGGGQALSGGRRRGTGGKPRSGDRLVERPAKRSPAAVPNGKADNKPRGMAGAARAT
jgi:hypothetical protein